MFKIRLITLVVFFSILDNVYAWGPRGHKIVSQIAEKYLDKNVKDSVAFYFDDLSIIKAGYWMDEVVMNSSYDFMKPWHYVTIEADKTYVKTKNPDVINVVENVITKLKTKKAGNRTETQLALKILIHLIADLHQPLHCGFSKDKNGNDYKLRFFYKSTTLHEVWDSEILEYSALSMEDCLTFTGNLTKSEVANLQSADVLKCMEESRFLLGNVYDFKAPKLGDEYVEKNVKIVKMQLVKAGIRLAGILNQIYKK